MYGPSMFGIVLNCTLYGIFAICFLTVFGVCSVKQGESGMRCKRDVALKLLL